MVSASENSIEQIGPAISTVWQAACTAVTLGENEFWGKIAESVRSALDAERVELTLAGSACVVARSPYRQVCASRSRGSGRDHDANGRNGREEKPAGTARSRVAASSRLTRPVRSEQGEVVGLLMAVFASDAVAEARRPLFEALAAQIGPIALLRGRYHPHAKALQQLRALRTLSSKLQSCKDLPEALQEIANHAADFLNAEACAAVIFSNETSTQRAIFRCWRWRDCQSTMKHLAAEITAQLKGPDKAGSQGQIVVRTRQQGHGRGIAIAVGFPIAESATSLIAVTGSAEQLREMNAEEFLKALAETVRPSLSSFPRLRKLQETLRNVRVIEELSRAFHQVLTLENLSKLVVSKARQAIPAAEAALLFLEDPKTQRLRPACVEGMKRPDLVAQLDLAKGEGTTGLALRQRRGLLMSNLTNEIPLLLSERNKQIFLKVAAEQRPKAQIIQPLLVPQRELGVLVLVSFSNPYAFTEDDLDFLGAICTQAALAMYNAQLLAELQRDKANLEELSRRIIRSQEEERRRISRELHDEAGQALTAIKLNAELLASKLPTEAADLRQIARDTANLASSLINEIRRIAAALRPAMLDDLGLLPTLRWYAKNIENRYSLKVRLINEGLNKRLDPTFEATVYRIVQEALTNVVRHAQANEATVKLYCNGAALRITISDDGRGMDPSAATVGTGLTGMRERAHLFGGTLRIESEPSKGTVLTVSFPSVPEVSR